MSAKKPHRRSLFFRIFLLFCLGAGVSLLIAVIAGRVLYTSEERPRTMIQQYAMKIHSFLLREMPSQPTPDDLRTFLATHPDFNAAVWKGNSLLFSSLNQSVDRRRFEDPMAQTEGRAKLLLLEHRLYVMSDQNGLTIISGHDFPLSKALVAKTFVVMILMTIGVFWVVYRFVSKQLAPILDLQKGTQEISMGNFQFRLPDAQSEEFEDLIRSFNAMAGKLETTFVNNTLMIGNLSHDLKAYITRLRMTTEVEVQDPAVKKSLTDDIQSLTGYLEQTLEAYRISSNKATFNFEPVPVTEFLKETINQQKKSAPGPHELAMEFPAKSPRVMIDQHFFRILLMNLLNNAQTYGENVLINLKSEDPRFTLEIVNSTRFPLDPADIPLLSQPFFRGEKARKIAGGHSGLGLYISRKICEAHHFRLDLELANGVFQVTITGSTIPCEIL